MSEQEWVHLVTYNQDGAPIGFMTIPAAMEEAVLKTKEKADFWAVADDRTDRYRLDHIDTDSHTNGDSAPLKPIPETEAKDD